MLKHKAISDSNFTGLKNQSTSEPIAIITSSINTANNYNKEIWVASFDISKAFDSVNLSSFNKAMKRIKLPTKIISLVLNLLNERELKLITYYKLSDPLKVSKGLDQGETLSPLLWTIFYDPMITKITTKYSTTSKILAYMDDVALFSSNMQSLQEATNTFCSFLLLNSIKCNQKKTELITNLSTSNQKRDQFLTVEGEKIFAKPLKEGIRYLGVYLSGKSSSTSTKNKLLEKVQKFTNAIASQKGWNGLITKQASHWIIPAQLDYAINASIPSDREITVLQRKMNRPIKAKLGVERTISNKILHSQAGLNTVKLQNR